MVEPEEVDLIKAFTRLGKLSRISYDMFIELVTAEELIDLAKFFEETAPILRARAAAMPPRVVELPELPPPGSQNSGPT